ncbi:hypothetical protein MKEN_00446500 [Mycena kentingensis (nom. inval.)]|nr:hypothetical protein MKEN_00446500 [Mycena kentingensis (nom. inval.)]
MTSILENSKLERILTDAVHGQHIPACFLAVTSADGEMYYSRQVGNDAASGGFDEDAVFWICSQTKLFTTVAALQLIETGKISLNTPVKGILPQLANPVVVTAYKDVAAGVGIASTVPAKNDVTFGQLLNHTSGLDYYHDGNIPMSGPWLGMPDAMRRPYTRGQGVEQFFETLKDDLPGVPLKFEPGTAWTYGFSTDVLGFVIERLTGQSLEEYFQEHIFKPLGMTSASFKLTPELKARLLPLTIRNANGSLVPFEGRLILEDEPGAYLGGVGVYASQKDYVKLLQHIMQIKLGQPVPKPLLPRASVDALFAPTLAAEMSRGVNGAVELYMPHTSVPSGAAQFSRGLFVNTERIPGKRAAGSGTWCGWANTIYFMDPASDVTMVFGTQLSPPGDDATMQVFDRLEREVYAALGK